MFESELPCSKAHSLQGGWNQSVEQSELSHIWPPQVRNDADGSHIGPTTGNRLRHFAPGAAKCGIARTVPHSDSIPPGDCALSNRAVRIRTFSLATSAQNLWHPVLFQVLAKSSTWAFACTP